MRKNRNKSIFDKFCNLLLEIDEKKKMNFILNFFLSDNEKFAISDRLIILRELIKGNLTQKQISKKYNISLATISRGSKALKTSNKIMIKVLQEYILK